MSEGADKQYQALNQVAAAQVAAPSRILADGDELSKDRAADIPMNPGAYSAVVLAAFGRVYITLGNRKVLVHPLFLLLACTPCFICQLSAMFALRTALELHNSIRDEAVHSSLQEHKNLWNYALVRLQVMMIGLFYVVQFRTLLICIKQVVFLLNPFSGVEIQRPTRQRWIGRQDNAAFRFMFKYSFFQKIALTAVLLRFFIGYLVCVDSVSLILGTSSAEDCIFNALAVTFVAELDGFWWQCLQLLFHMPEEAGGSGASLLLRRRKEVWDGEHLRPDVASRIGGFLVRLAALTTWRKVSPRSWLSRSYGFKHVEQFLALVLLWFMYNRQITMVLFSIETGVLPVTRDVCAHFLLHNGKLVAHDWPGQAGLMVLRMVNRALERVLVVDARKEFENLAVAGHLQHGGLDCSSERFRLMTPRDAVNVRAKFAFAYYFLSFTLLALFVVPHLVISLHSTVFPARADDLSAREDDADFADDDLEQQSDIEELQAKVKDAERRLQELECALPRHRANNSAEESKAP